MTMPSASVPTASGSSATAVVSMLPATCHGCLCRCNSACGGEPLDAPAGRGFTDIEIAFRVDAHAVRPQHLAGLTAAVAELADDFEIAPPQRPHFEIRAVGEIEPLLAAIRR